MGVSTTVSLNGGPEVPIDLSAKGIKRMMRKLEADTAEAAASRERQADDAEPAGISAERLRSLVERIERLEEERKSLGSDIKDIFAEAKSAGFDVKVMRQIIRLRKLEPAEVEEQEALLDVYRRALGM
jgi:uncharacterized protein (UPF0335 family)